LALANMVTANAAIVRIDFFILLNYF